MDVKRWQLFFLHSCIVLFGLAIETYFPLAKGAICAIPPIILFPTTEPSKDNSPIKNDGSQSAALSGISLYMGGIYKEWDENASID